MPMIRACCLLWVLVGNAYAQSHLKSSVYISTNRALLPLAERYLDILGPLLQDSSGGSSTPNDPDQYFPKDRRGDASIDYDLGREIGVDAGYEIPLRENVLNLAVGGTLSYADWNKSYKQGLGIFVERIRIQTQTLTFSPKVYVTSADYFHPVEVLAGVRYDLIKSWDLLELGRWKIREQQFIHRPFFYLGFKTSLFHERVNAFVQLNNSQVIFSHLGLSYRF